MPSHPLVVLVAPTSRQIPSATSLGAAMPLLARFRLRGYAFDSHRSLTQTAWLEPPRCWKHRSGSPTLATPAGTVLAFLQGRHTKRAKDRSAHAHERRPASPPSARCGSPSKGSAGLQPSAGPRHRRSVSCGRPHQRAAGGLPGRRRHRTGGVADAAPMSSARGCRSPFPPSSVFQVPALARPGPQARLGGRGLSAPVISRRNFGYAEGDTGVPGNDQSVF